MNCLAIDDEPLALDIITEFCSKIGYLNLIGTFTNPWEASRILSTTRTDLIFLDIHMPNISGFEFLRSLYKPPMIIFTTAFKEHASEGFNFDAIDYLVKPFSFDRFSKSVNKAFQLMKMSEYSNSLNEENTRILHEFLMIKAEYSVIRVKLDDILYIEGLKDYIKIYTSRKLLLTKTTIKNFLDKLPGNFFIRVHKSYIVSIDKIDKIENRRILIGNQSIPIGESFRTSFFDFINKNSI